jgi:hypothetical protein
MKTIPFNQIQNIWPCDNGVQIGIMLHNGDFYFGYNDLEFTPNGIKGQIDKSKQSIELTGLDDIWDIVEESETPDQDDLHGLWNGDMHM